MQSRYSMTICGNSVARLFKHCGRSGVLSAAGGYFMWAFRFGFHTMDELSHTVHSRIHTLFFRCRHVVSHIIHSTYNYNNLYKENCV